MLLSFRRTLFGVQVVKVRSSRMRGRRGSEQPMPRRKSASGKCLATRCSGLMEPTAVFCRNHWDQLPEALREAIQRVILRGKHDEAVTVVTEAIRYLDIHRTPRRL